MGRWRDGRQLSAPAAAQGATRLSMIVSVAEHQPATAAAAAAGSGHSDVSADDDARCRLTAAMTRGGKYVRQSLSLQPLHNTAISN